MKKSLLLICVLVIAIAGMSQERKRPISSEKINMPLTIKVEDLREPVPPPMLNEIFSSPGVLKESGWYGVETEIIETVYDLQTNAGLGNRFWVWPDGKMAAVCTRGMTAPNFPDRGTGYNFFDGTQWGPKPTARLESVRTGWPSIAPWGPNGEIVVAHTTAAAPYPLRMLRRENKGTGPWTEFNVTAPGGTFEPSWPRIATSGNNNEIIHLVYNSYNAHLGQEMAVVYSRSTDGGTTWFPFNEVLPGMGSDYYSWIRADSYILASRNNVVALLVFHAFHDLFVMKTTDHGDSWQKIMIWEHPYPFFDFNTTLTTDTLYSVDNSANIAIDDNGMIHVVWGITRVARLASNPPSPGSYSYWPYTDGIGYWNESMGQIPDAPNVHHTMKPEYLAAMGMLVGWTQDLNNSGMIFDFEGTGNPPFNVYRSLGISTMPTISVNGNMVAIAYSSVTETYVTPDGTQNYKRIWVRLSYDKGQTWGPFIHLQADNIFHLYDESIYPLLAQHTYPQNVFHLIYNADNIPGLYLDQDHDPVVNRLIHNKMDFILTTPEPKVQGSSLIVSQNFPNPARQFTAIIVELAEPSVIRAEIFNIQGQKVFDLPARDYPAGIHNLRFDLSGFASGTYFYTVSNGKESVSRKMIVR